jgi:hypothetical protein
MRIQFLIMYQGGRQASLNFLLVVFSFLTVVCTPQVVLCLGNALFFVALIEQLSCGFVLQLIRSYLIAKLMWIWLFGLHLGVVELV